MRSIFQKIFNELRKVARLNMVKVFSFTAISTSIRMLTGFVSMKVVAVIIGPVGIALLGQLNSFMSIVTTIASGGVNSGITKNISEHKNETQRIKIFISTAFYITLLCSLVCSVGLILFSKSFSKWIFLDSQYSYVIIILGISIILYAVNNMLLSILNGYQEYKKYVAIGIISSLVGLIFTVALVFSWKLKGALIAAVSYQSVVCFITMAMVCRYTWFNKSYFFARFSKFAAKNYAHYALMTSINACTVPVSQLIIRWYAMKTISVSQAGIWEAMNRLSGVYLSIFTSSFMVYYLPRLSELKKKAEIRSEVLLAYKIIIPILLVSFSLIYIFREYIVHLVFSAEFDSVTNLFIWQLLGDFFKMCSWILTFIMIAKTMTFLYIVTEILCYGVLIIFSIIFVNHLGVIGITQAYALNYFLYLILVLILFRKLFRKESTTLI